MDTIGVTIVRLDDLASIMERLTLNPVPAEVLERRRRVLSEAEKVRAAMKPLPGDIKDLIRKERGEEPLG